VREGVQLEHAVEKRKRMGRGRGLGEAEREYDHKQGKFPHSLFLFNEKIQRQRGERTGLTVQARERSIKTFNGVHFIALQKFEIASSAARLLAMTSLRRRFVPEAISTE